MKFVKQTSDLPRVLANRLSSALASHQRVIWLVPGGSNIPISAAAMKLIDEALSAKLVIMQTDERFVAPDSPDCNWRQLRLAGFDTKQAEIYPIIQGDNLTLEQTTGNYQKNTAEQFDKADYILGQFGIGPDGHVAGIKPNSSAITANALVAGYKAEDFVRVTLTTTAIKDIDEALAFAFGDEKISALTKLKQGGAPLKELPAGVLSSIQNCTVYNDQVED